MSNRIADAVRAWVDENYEEDYTECLEDLMEHGCVSGMVSSLCYYKDTCDFYERHKEEINDLLRGIKEESGLSMAELFGDKWNNDDPLALDAMNQNLLAWFGFETVASNLMDKEVTA